MKKEAKKNSILTTPRCKLNYPWLNRPDTTFDADGAYATNGVFSKRDAKSMMALCDKVHEKAQIKFEDVNKKGKEASLPYFENDDGDIEFKFTQKAVIKNKKGETFKKTVAVLDSKRRPVVANIGRDTIAIIAFEPVPYYHPSQGAGCTLRLKAVQIIKLVEYVDGTEYGFDEEDGFEGDDNSDEKEDFDNESDKEAEDEAEADDGDETDEDVPF